jgi:hypothetical protein
VLRLLLQSATVQMVSEEIGPVNIAVPPFSTERTTGTGAEIWLVCWLVPVDVNR